MNRPLPTTLAELQEIQLLSLVTVDGHHWLLPQAEIRLLGPLLDIDQEVTTPCSIGAVGLEAVSYTHLEVATASDKVKLQSDTVIAVAEDERKTVELATFELSSAAEAMQQIAQLAQTLSLIHI